MNMYIGMIYDMCKPDVMNLRNENIYPLPCVTIYTCTCRYIYRGYFIFITGKNLTPGACDKTFGGFRGGGDDNCIQKTIHGLKKG